MFMTPHVLTLDMLGQEFRTVQKLGKHCVTDNVVMAHEQVHLAVDRVPTVGPYTYIDSSDVC